MAVNSEYGEAYGTGTDIWGICGNAHSEYGESNGTRKINWGLGGGAHSECGESHGTGKVIWGYVAVHIKNMVSHTALAG
jgi:hypothetical protein